MPMLRGGRNGCKAADKKLGGLSSCFECLFMDCIFEITQHAQTAPLSNPARKRRNKRINADLKVGMAVEDVALKYGLSITRVREIKEE